MAEKEKETYKTQLGTYTREKGDVYVSASVDRDNLVVPAEYSNTGKDKNLQFNPHTVLYTEQDTSRGTVIEAVEKMNPGTITPQYLKDISLIASFAGAAQDIAGVRHVMSTFGEGLMAGKTSEHGNGFIKTLSYSAEKFISEAVGVKRENLNLTDGEIRAWGPAMAAHELYHLKDDKVDMRNVLAAEIKADFGSLRDYFNKDYKTFSMDARALRSLNVVVAGDDHATHIWAEEYKKAMPTIQESRAIGVAPIRIQDTMYRSIASHAPAGTTDVEVMKELSDPAQRYGALKALREQDAFKDIPYGNEFVDKYLVAAERRYTPEYLAISRVDEFRQMVAPVSPQASVTNMPAPAAPAQALGL